MTPTPPQPSWRKPVGMLIILIMIALWAGLIAHFAGAIGRLPGLVQVVIYAVAGIVWIWILPLRPLLQWMETGRWRAPR